MHNIFPSNIYFVQYVVDVRMTVVEDKNSTFNTSSFFLLLEACLPPLPSASYLSSFSARRWADLGVRTNMCCTPARRSLPMRVVNVYSVGTVPCTSPQMLCLSPATLHHFLPIFISDRRWCRLGPLASRATWTVMSFVFFSLSLLSPVLLENKTAAAICVRSSYSNYIRFVWFRPTLSASHLFFITSILSSTHPKNSKSIHPIIN